MIPKILHYFWVNKNKNEEIPEKILKNIESWKKYCPDWEIKLWDESSFDMNSTTFTKQCYERGLMGYIPDYVRFWALYNYGGIYLDADVEILKPIDDLLNKNCFFGWEHENYNPKFLGTAIIGAEKGHRLMEYLMKFYENYNIYDDCDNLVLSASNFIVPKVIDLFPDKENVEILSQSLMYPENENLIQDSHYFIHKSIASWVKNCSIIIPTDNNEKTIKKCIDSCLNQTWSNLHYEIIIVDNCSTDNTFNIISEYKDNRIFLLKNSEKTNKADCLNLGLKKASGKTCLFLDPTKELKTNAINNALHAIEQYNFDLAFFNSNYLENKKLTFDEILNGKIDYSGMIINKQSLNLLPYFFEAYYHDNEYYKFAINCALRNLKIWQLNTGIFKNENFKPKESKRMKKLFNSNNESELTCIISFRCEKWEVEKTVASLRYTARNIKILLMDDCSDDDFDYKWIAKTYNCDYYRNSERRGSAGTKHDGANMCTTPYFCFFDGHQRVYNNNWDINLIKLLKQHPNDILSARTIYISQNEDGTYINEDARHPKRTGGYSQNYCGINACCYITDKLSYEFDPKWVGRFENNNPKNKLSPVACVLGAVYAMSKEHWLKIHGFKGLVIYGLEETFMSIKTWLAGGKCYLIKNWGVGHLYRDKNASYIDPSNVDANRMYLMHFFSDDDDLITFHKFHLQKRIGPKAFKKAIDIFNEHQLPILQKEKDYFFNQVATKPLSYFLEFNEKVKQHNNVK